jgi:outer membrane protein OmpA-like peptidoglycan-associated protein
MNNLKILATASAAFLLSAGLALSVEPNTRVFADGHKDKIRGVMLSRDGNTLNLRGDDDSLGTVDLTDDTKIQIKHGIFGQKTDMKADSLVPGLEIEARGKGSENGDLVASKVVFDPNSMRVSRQVDARVDPVESRTGVLEDRADQQDSRAGQIEDRQGKLEGQEQQTEQQVGQVSDRVGQVKTEADQANQEVENVNQRVTNLDNYQEKYSAVVYFKLNSSTLTPEDKQKLDTLAEQAKGEKGYSVQIAGYADKTGNAAYNQHLSQARADTVITYLEEQGDIPINRILTPAGLGTTHQAADNSTSAGRKLNRRVEVKVFVNQGLIATSNESTATATAALPDAPKF